MELFYFIFNVIPEKNDKYQNNVKNYRDFWDTLSLKTNSCTILNAFYYLLLFQYSLNLAHFFYVIH